MTKAWVVRAGSAGEQEEANLAEGFATIGWNLPDLTSATTREEIRSRVEDAYPDDSPGRQANFTGQVWAFRNRIRPGDIVIMPSKFQPGYLYLGKCSGNYAYAQDETHPQRRHRLPVEWLSEPISKSVIKDDLLYSLNAIMTVFNPSRNNAAERVLALYNGGADPGDLEPSASPAPERAEAVISVVQDEVTDPDPAPTLEAIRDRIRRHLVENFREHKLTHLVADILEARGFNCEVSPPGPDGGVDILAGRGPLGLDSPTLIVEVKSEPTPVDVKVVRGLHSAMTQHRADQGLLVAWGGATKPAMREFKRDRTSFRVWDAEQILDQLFDTYEQLPAATRGQIPLTQAWVLEEEAQ